MIDVQDCDSWSNSFVEMADSIISRGCKFQSCNCLERQTTCKLDNIFIINTWDIYTNNDFTLDETCSSLEKM